MKYLKYYMEFLDESNQDIIDSWVNTYNIMKGRCSSLSDFELYGFIMAWLNDFREFNHDIGQNFSMAYAYYTNTVNEVPEHPQMDWFSQAAIRDYILSSGRLESHTRSILKYLEKSSNFKNGVTEEQQFDSFVKAVGRDCILAVKSLCEQHNWGN